jgi:hypothetical protein
MTPFRASTPRASRSQISQFSRIRPHEKMPPKASENTLHKIDRYLKDIPFTRDRLNPVYGNVLPVFFLQFLFSQEVQEMKKLSWLNAGKYVKLVLLIWLVLLISSSVIFCVFWRCSDGFLLQRRKFFLIMPAHFKSSYPYYKYRSLLLVNLVGYYSYYRREKSILSSCLIGLKSEMPNTRQSNEWERQLVPPCSWTYPSQVFFFKLMTRYWWANSKMDGKDGRHVRPVPIEWRTDPLARQPSA